ncbi:ACP S-malonyltransferase [Micromonospora halophytica]|uniref:Malonyl CoA-acyl carrier protein transacylase n=1 Tax=Micromonospora halophytica TaxID=47864 RepID=A0A1C5ILK9_9ACTN|nr:ACP S-malonyltransferase [Micromonospora halophytica]SCG59238.1 [acyl-carrier-protein] S-malonyltransferase [Micromonospora halophytica]
MRSPRYALLFPGQGAQFPGMAERFHDRSPTVRDLFDTAERQTGLPLRQICFHTDRIDQARTDWNQPAVFLAGLAGWYALTEEWERRGVTNPPVCVAGHSLGHFTALAAAGALSTPDALELVRRRGELMHAASLASGGAMATLVGLAESTVARLVREADDRAVSVAAVNGPDQVVVSGADSAVEKVMDRALHAGAERVVRLAIALAAHSPLMASAAAQFAPLVSAAALREPRTPVLLNTTGHASRDVAEIRADLHRHMLAPVQWWRCLQTARDAGVELLVDGGPGRTLSKVMRRDLPAGAVHSLDHPRGAEALLP